MQVFKCLNKVDVRLSRVFPWPCDVNANKINIILVGSCQPIFLKKMEILHIVVSSFDWHDRAIETSQCII